MTKTAGRDTITYEVVHRARPRNAAATRAALLEAARTLFARDGYDDVGMRDIARQVGVDAAMASRYFGSKEDLFIEALGACGDDSRSLTDGERSDFGRRIAHQLVYEPQECDKLHGLLIMLRANGSAKAAQMVQRTIIEDFLRPFEEWVGGEKAVVRARLATSLVMGFALSRSLLGDLRLDEADKAAMFERLAELLQRCVDA
jgi:AcrR family transcriptional regulator